MGEILGIGEVNGVFIRPTPGLTASQECIMELYDFKDTSKY